jgi:gamma-glutamylcysteine synthetase
MLRLPSLLGKDKKFELILQDTDVAIIAPDEVNIEKATFINSRPNKFEYMKCNKLVIKNCDRNKVDGSYMKKFYANHCLISKCEIGTGDRKTSWIPDCKFAYLDACHLRYGRVHYPIQGIYYNRCYLKDWVKSDLSKLEFVSFDKSDDYGYAKCIKYYTKNKIPIRYHTDEQFQDLVKKVFK